MIARFSYLLALKWNLCEENVFPIDQIYEFTDYIQALDWAEHPVTFHNPMDWFQDYENLLGDDHYTVTSIQYERSQAGEYVEQWRNRSSDFGRPWVIDMDENGPAGIGLSSLNADELRKEILYDVYFSGGNVEWYAGYHDLPVGGDVRLEDFRTRELMWQYTWYARRFIEENLPFWNMSPADWLLVNESEDHGGGQVFALPGELYAVYLPNASSGGVLNVEGDFILRWYNPRTGEFEGLPQSISATDSIILEPPIADVQNDWVVLIQSPNIEESAGWDFDITPAYP
jgi:hypothetical protein